MTFSWWLWKSEDLMEIDQVGKGMYLDGILPS